MKNSTLFYKEEFSKQMLDYYHSPDKLELLHGCKSHWLNLPHHLCTFLKASYYQDQ